MNHGPAVNIPTSDTAAHRYGDMLRRLWGPNQRMGAWTGLRPALGAPLSGALLGAALGGVYGLGRGAYRAITGTGEEEEPSPWWKSPMAMGLASGLLLGGASGIAQEKKGSLHQKVASYREQRLKQLIAMDPSITHYEKDRLLGLVGQASETQVSRMIALAASGALTAAAAHHILGTGAFGSTVAGGLGAFVASRFIPGKTRYV